MSEEKMENEVKQEVIPTEVVAKEEKTVESNEMIEIKKEELSGISISEEVVATIASIAASEVNGVASMSGGFVGGLSEMLGKKTKGVRVQVGEKDTVIDINLMVEYGARIPDIAWEVQNKVKTQVESMTGLNVVSVNIHVQNVSFQKKNNSNESNNSSNENSEEK